MERGEFYPGDKVLITSGTFHGFSGVVRGGDIGVIPPERDGVVLLEVTIFGRVTPVPVPIDDLTLA
jgi:transcription antitermination factor NusG